MVNLVNLLATAPKGVWATIIQAFNNVFVNYAVAIIMLTLCIKLVMLPFDFLNKRVAKKQQEAQAIMQPELLAIEKKYGNDKEKLNQKTQELYKKNNVNLGGSCIIMLLNLVFTFTVFITLFNGLNAMSSYKIQSQYETLESAYVSVITDTTNEKYEDLTVDKINDYINTISADETKKATADALVNTKYKEIKDSWLWIDNIWLADSPFAKKIPTFKEYLSTSRIKFKAVKDESGNEIKNSVTVRNEAQKRYETIMNPLQAEHKGVNGYFILAVLTVVSSFIMQYGAQKGWLRKKSVREKLKGQQVKPNAMMIIMPLLMGYFTLMYNSVFSLYIVIGQLFSFVTSPIIDLILDTLDEKAAIKRQQPNKGRIVK